MRIFFCTPFFRSVVNGPGKFANLLYNSTHSDRITFITEDPPELPAENIIGISRPPKHLRFSIGTQYHRSKAYLEVLKPIVKDGDVAVFNNVLTAYHSAQHLSVPVLGFLNDDNNLLQRLLGARSLQQLSRAILRRWEGRCVHMVDGLVTNSSYLTKSVEQHYRVAPNKIHILYKGLNVEVASTYKPIEEGPVRILFVKSDFVRGNLLQLIQAVKQICETRPANLTVIGVTKGKFTNWLRVRGEKHCDLDRVTFLGPLPQSRVTEEMTRAHIFCVPSQAEALGVANMEAMIRSVPVVTTGVGGIPEVTDNGANCWTIKENTPTGIAQAIAKCWEQPEKTAKKVASARVYVEQKFDQRRTSDRFVAIVDAVRLSHRSSSS